MRALNCLIQAERSHLFTPLFTILSYYTYYTRSPRTYRLFYLRSDFEITLATADAVDREGAPWNETDSLYILVWVKSHVLSTIFFVNTATWAL